MLTALKNTTATRFRVQSTSDLERFNEIPNRDASHLHVLSIVRSMKERVLYSPIYVNERYDVIDGQHRLKALKIMQTNVDPAVQANYIVFDNMGYDSNVIPLYNTNSSNWKIDDFINSHISRNNENVALANEFFKLIKGLPKGVGMYMLKGESKLKSVREGTVHISQEEYDKGVEFYNALVAFRDAGFKRWNHFQFIKAFHKVYNSVGYEHEKMLKALKTSKAKLLVLRRTVQDYERDLRFIYPD